MTTWKRSTWLRPAAPGLRASSGVFRLLLRSSGQRRISARHRCGWAPAQAGGHFADIRRLCLNALVLARDGGDAVAFARAALALGAALRPGVIDSVLVEWLEEALARLGPGRSPERCLVTARLAAALQPAPQPLLLAARAGALPARAPSAQGALVDREGDLVFHDGRARQLWSPGRRLTGRHALGGAQAEGGLDRWSAEVARILSNRLRQ